MFWNIPIRFFNFIDCLSYWLDILPLGLNILRSNFANTWEIITRVGFHHVSVHVYLTNGQTDVNWNR